MWQLITGFGPDLPPQVAKVGFTKPNGAATNFWTHGALLLQQIPETINHDPDLLATVAWCMGELSFFPSQNAGPAYGPFQSCLSIKLVSLEKETLFLRPNCLTIIFNGNSCVTR